MKKSNVYLAGPMRGYNYFNFPAFHAAARMLRASGIYEVRSPAEHDEENGFDPTLNSLEGFDMAQAFRWDVESVLGADQVIVLPGWESSTGVNLELDVAESIGTPVYEMEIVTVPWVDYKLHRLTPEDRAVRKFTGPEPSDYLEESVGADTELNETPLQEAHRLIHGPRQASYGHPYDDFTRTGKLWGAILGIDPVPPEQVGLCQVALKISRELNAHKRDNVVDMAGYAGTVGLVMDRKAELEG